MFASLLPRSSGNTVAIGALVAGAVLMGLSPVAVRLADVGPITSAFWRVALALPVLWLWMRAAEGRQASTPRRAWSRPTILAGATFTGDLLCWHSAIARTTVANATFFATMAPLWVVVFGWLLFRTRVGRPVLAGLGLCLLGGALLVVQSLTFAPGHVAGDLLGVATGVFFGLYFLAVRAARDAEIGAARVIFQSTVVSVILLLIAALSVEHRFLPGSAMGWGAVMSLAFVSHAGGQGLLAFALGVLPAAFSSLVIFLQAIAAALAALLILGEPISAVQLCGGVLIVAGIWVARPSRPATLARDDRGPGAALARGQAGRQAVGQAGFDAV